MEIMRAPSADKGSVLAKLSTLTVALRFTQEMFPALWDAALRYGIDPVGLVAQSYKETGKGKFLSGWRRRDVPAGAGRRR